VESTARHDAIESVEDVTLDEKRESLVTEKMKKKIQILISGVEKEDSIGGGRIPEKLMVSTEKDGKWSEQVLFDKFDNEIQCNEITLNVLKSNEKINPEQELRKSEVLLENINNDARKHEKTLDVLNLNQELGKSVVQLEEGKNSNTQNVEKEIEIQSKADDHKSGIENQNENILKFSFGGDDFCFSGDESTRQSYVHFMGNFQIRPVQSQIRASQIQTGCTQSNLVHSSNATEANASKSDTFRPKRIKLGPLVFEYRDDLTEEQLKVAQIMHANQILLGMEQPDEECPDQSCSDQIQVLPSKVNQAKSDTF
jgi:hypothetical protein